MGLKDPLCANVCVFILTLLTSRTFNSQFMSIFVLISHQTGFFKGAGGD